jgi:polyribonucleotide nucleotidyltransferase
MIIREKVRVGDQIVTLETGRIAKQAGGSCLVRAGDTMVLVTVCGNQDAKPGQSFFPLSVDYVEKTYSAGKIPGGFFKREGKLRDYEVLTSRLIDRPCRPLFPEGYLAEVQIVATVMSFDKENPPDTLAMIGASAALHISQIPWKGPIAGVRVGRIDGEFIANPTFAQIAESDCELIVAASRDAIVMVEGEADEMSEEDLIDALLFAHHAIQDSLDLMDRMRSAVGKPKWSFHAETTPSFLKDRVEHVAGRKVREACNIAEKHARYDRFKQIKRELVEAIAHEFPGQEQQITTTPRVPRCSKRAGASTAVTRARCARSASSSAFCHAPMARRCSRAARRRRSSPPPSVRRATSSASTCLRATSTRTSCFTTTSRPTRSVR